MGRTPAQERVCAFVRDCLQRFGHAPSRVEIRRDLGFESPDAVCGQVRRLEERDCLPAPAKDWERSFEPIPLRTGAASLLVFLGTVAAGNPIEAVEIPEAIEVPESFLGNGNNFALRVRGDSMVEEGIHEGDILIITRQSHAESGQTVVALIRGEATVKKFYRHGDEIELRPANERMQSLRLRECDLKIVGTVVGLLRHYRPSAPHRA